VFVSFLNRTDINKKWLIDNNARMQNNQLHDFSLRAEPVITKQFLDLSLRIKNIIEIGIFKKGFNFESNLV
jgi:hypothetical protein